MKKITLFLVLAFCLTIIGCSKNEDITAFITEWDTVTNDLVQKINGGDIDGAKVAFDGKKESLKSKWAAIKDAKGFQVSEDSKKKLEESMKKNMSAITGAMTGNMMKLATDKAKMDKLQGLIKDYGEIFKP